MWGFQVANVPGELLREPRGGPQESKRLALPPLWVGKNEVWPPREHSRA